MFQCSAPCIGHHTRAATLERWSGEMKNHNRLPNTDHHQEAATSRRRAEIHNRQVIVPLRSFLQGCGKEIL